MTSSITEMLAMAVEEARQQAGEAQTAYAEAQAKADAIASRIHEASTKQAAITSRRLAGTATPDEAAEHHALSHDLQELQRMHAQASRDAELASPDEAVARLARAEHEWRAHQERETIRLVHERCVELESRFTSCLAELAALVAAAGGQNLRDHWTPSPALETAMLHSRPQTIASVRRAA